MELFTKTTFVCVSSDLITGICVFSFVVLKIPQKLILIMIESLNIRDKVSYRTQLRDVELNIVLTNKTDN